MKMLMGLLLAVAFLNPLAPIAAYGGGGVGPGWFGSPVQKECHWEERTVLHFTFWLKRCEITRDEGFRDRVREFVDRLRHGRDA
jgi:hypothetical protein